MSYKPAIYSYGIYDIILMFKYSDYNERFLFFNIKYTEKNGVKYNESIIYDRKLRKFWYDWKHTNFIPLTKTEETFYRCVNYNGDGDIEYYIKLNILDSIIDEIGYSGGFSLAIKSRIDKRKRYDNPKFKDFLENVYKRECIERDL